LGTGHHNIFIKVFGLNEETFEKLFYLHVMGFEPAPSLVKKMHFIYDLDGPTIEENLFDIKVRIGLM
jgi:hypothetical protein